MQTRVGVVLSVFRAAFGNRELRRIGSAYALFGASEYGIWIALLVFAYRVGGPTDGMIIVLAQLLPCIALGPFLGALADRRRPSRVLFVGYGIQACSMAGVAVSIGVGAPVALSFALAPLTALGLTLTRPPQAAVLPAIVRTPDELTAANVMTGWTDAAAALFGPLVAGVMLAWHGPVAAIGATAGMSAVAMIAVAGVVGPEAAVSRDETVEPDEQEGAAGVFESRVGRAFASIRSGARENLALVVRNPEIRVLLTLHAFYFMLIGALDLICVLLALSLLHMGPGGPGFLNAALGGGALLAGLVTVFLVGRRRLANTLTIALLVAVAALASIDAIPRVTFAIVLIAVVGLAGTVFDVTGRTLLQRAAPADAIAGSFSILEALMDTGLALGAVLVRLAISIAGVRAALLAPAVIAVVLMAPMWNRLRRIDAAATVPQVEIQLLRSIPIFAALPAPELEGMARELEAVTVASGEMVIRQGDLGDCYYVVADGQLEVSRDGRVVQTVKRGDGFGEIALIREVPRQASVRAVTDASLYRLRKDRFLQTVTGHVSASRAVGTTIAGYLGETGES